MDGPRSARAVPPLLRPVAVALVAGLAITLLAFVGAREMGLDRLGLRFHHATASLELAARQRMEDDLEALYNLRDAHDLRGRLTRAEFTSLARELLARHPGVRALEWVPVVPEAGRAAFEAAARREGLAGFRLTDRDGHGGLTAAPQRAVHYPVFYVEPLAGNEAALGYAPDLPPRDAAIAAARDTGRPVASEAFPIVQERDGRMGVAVFLPVYAGAARPHTVAARRAAMTSLMEGLLVPADVLHPLADQARGLGIGISLTDPQAALPARVLVADRTPGRAALLRHEVPLAVGGRDLTLAFTLGDDRVLGGVRGVEWLVLAVGLLATGLTASYLSFLANRRARAEAVAEARTRALDQAQALDRMKTDFVNAVTHDLRAPLTSVVGYAEFLDEEVGGPLTPAQREYVRQIGRGARRLERLMDDMLDVARLDAGVFELRREPTDLARLVREVAGSLGPQLAEAGIALDFSAVAPTLPAVVDQARIERVLYNLMSNAIKFTPSGGTIRVRAEAEGPEARIEVADTGVGIDPTQRDQLFQRFRQLPGGAAKGGTGLGLSIARAIVEAHGGRIGVDSERGQGATFWFRLPLAGPGGAGA